MQGEVTQTQNSLEIKGLRSVESAIKDIKSHKSTYIVFDFDNIDPVQIRVLSVGGIDTSSNIRATPSVEQLQNVFSACRDHIQSDKACFIGYSFGYYNEKNNYRDMVLLISFIPDGINFRQKIAYASNVALLLARLDIPVHIQAHDLSDVEYSRIASECSSIQRI